MVAREGTVNLTMLVRRYRAFDPTTGRFTARRSLTKYAADLGTVSPSLLSHVFAGRKQPGLEVVRGLARLTSGHPRRWREILTTLVATDDLVTIDEAETREPAGVH